MRALSFRDITRRLEEWRFPGGLDGVVGIANGGIVPAALVAQRLQLELKLIALNYRDDANEPRFEAPKLLSPVPELAPWRRILLVDDVYVSGRSWHAARALLSKDVEVLPFVFKGKTDFALIRDIEGCVRWPWKPV
jgi:uncharacterized protein